MTITHAQLKDRLHQLLAGIDSTDPSDLSARLSEFLQYSVENYESLDEEAKAYIDGVFEKLRKVFQHVADSLADGEQKRQLLRHLGVVEGSHFRAENLIQILESPPQNYHPILPAAINAFAMLIQKTLDVLFDATRHTHQGPANFVKVGLCYWAIDELLAAIHLAQRGFTNQSYAHIRTNFEILDLVELFDRQPEWAQLWISGNDKEVWAELRPSAVRKKLGEPKFDPVYSFFSELGSHGTFRGLQARAVQIVEPQKPNSKRFKIWVGGSPLVDHIVCTNTFCVYTALKLLVKCIEIFAQHLNADEMKGIIETSGEITAQFFRDHYVNWAKEEGLEYRPLIEFLDTKPWMITRAET